ncbi:hypothetical protein [Bacillus sp. ISL-55]|uniref:hypothetical protein n=1 Tax=Bacillus sp. ISL-55 TaxID=2819134 RepID=UPI001BEC4ACB|nr:hypothetical protein [Bacillus sp. ISL-55]MBT2695008.1 hypothetical protein [Bacillus sp. ISL-55]
MKISFGRRNRKCGRYLTKSTIRLEKRKRLVQHRQALEGLTVKSLFDFIGRAETSRGARRWS